MTAGCQVEMCLGIRRANIEERKVFLAQGYPYLVFYYNVCIQLFVEASVVPWIKVHIAFIIFLAFASEIAYNE